MTTAVTPGRELLMTTDEIISRCYEHGQPDYVLAADRLKELQQQLADALAKGAALFCMIPDDIADGIDLGDVQAKWKELRARLAAKPSEGVREALADRLQYYADNSLKSPERHRLDCAEAATFLAAKPSDARPLEEYHEDMGPMLWWKFPIEEAPYCGSPLDCGMEVLITLEMRDMRHVRAGTYEEGSANRFHVGGWPGYHTHFTPIPIPTLPLTTTGEPTP